MKGDGRAHKDARKAVDGDGVALNQALVGLEDGTAAAVVADDIPPDDVAAADGVPLHHYAVKPQHAGPQRREFLCARSVPFSAQSCTLPAFMRAPAQYLNMEAVGC